MAKRGSKGLRDYWKFVKEQAKISRSGSIRKARRYIRYMISKDVRYKNWRELETGLTEYRESADYVPEEPFLVIEY